MIFYNKYIQMIFGILFSISVHSQSFSSRSIPSALNCYNNERVQNYSRADLDLVLKRGNSIASNTKLLQDYIDSHQEIILPNRELTVGKNGLLIGNNKTIKFQKNTVLKMEPNILGTNGILNIIDAKNVTILHANLVGDRYQHKSNVGEWGMGIRIVGGENVTVDNFIVRNCWGDGIYVGRNGYQYSKNITLKNGNVDNNRRNGISITGVDGLNISNVVAANSNGAPPEAGIDFETNDNRDEMTNIWLNNVVTYNNNNIGLMFSISKMLDNKNKSKKVNVEIVDYKDHYSKKIGLLIAAVRDNYGILSGNISLNNLEFNYNSKPFIIKSISSNKFKVNVGDYVFKNQLNKNVTKQEFERVYKGNPSIYLK